MELCWKGTVWMNDELTLDYLDRLFGGSLFGGKRLLVWDSFRCHLVNRKNKENIELKKKLRESNLYTAVIPGGCTKFIQVPDVSWNGPFKAHFRKSFDRWMANDAQKEFTSGGNPKAPAMDVYLQWIAEAWDSLPAEAMITSMALNGDDALLMGVPDQGETHLNQLSVQGILSLTNRGKQCLIVNGYEFIKSRVTSNGTGTFHFPSTTSMSSSRSTPARRSVSVSQSQQTQVVTA